MPAKIIELEGVGNVKLVKSSRNKQLKLSIQNGTVRVSMPFWTPFSTGSAFASQHRDWIIRHMQSQPIRSLIQQGQKIGKLHHIVFEAVDESIALTSRVTTTKIIVKHRYNQPTEDQEVQSRAEAACLRALKKEGMQLLPERTRRLALAHGFNFKTVNVKQLKRRWGSCDSQKNIIYNLFLMQLPWELIDYVILHELTHTEQMNHGPLFWERMRSVNQMSPDLRRQLKHHQPLLNAPISAS